MLLVRDHPQVREIDMLYACDYSQMDISRIQLKIAETKKKQRFIANQMLYVIKLFLF